MSNRTSTISQVLLNLPGIALIAILKGAGRNIGYVLNCMKDESVVATLLDKFQINGVGYLEERIGVVGHRNLFLFLQTSESRIDLLYKNHLKSALKEVLEQHDLNNGFLDIRNIRSNDMLLSLIEEYGANPAFLFYDTSDAMLKYGITRDEAIEELYIKAIKYDIKDALQKDRVDPRKDRLELSIEQDPENILTQSQLRPARIFPPSGAKSFDSLLRFFCNFPLTKRVIELNREDLEGLAKFFGGYDKIVGIVNDPIYHDDSFCAMAVMDLCDGRLVGDDFAKLMGPQALLTLLSGANKDVEFLIKNLKKLSKGNLVGKTLQFGYRHFDSDVKSIPPQELSQEAVNRINLRNAKFTEDQITYIIEEKKCDRLVCEILSIMASKDGGKPVGDFIFKKCLEQSRVKQQDFAVAVKEIYDKSVVKKFFAKSKFFFQEARKAMPVMLEDCYSEATMIAILSEMQLQNEHLFADCLVMNCCKSSDIGLKSAAIKQSFEEAISLKKRYAIMPIAVNDGWALCFAVFNHDNRTIEVNYFDPLSDRSLSSPYFKEVSDLIIETAEAKTFGIRSIADRSINCRQDKINCGPIIAEAAFLMLQSKLQTDESLLELMNGRNIARCRINQAHLVASYLKRDFGDVQAAAAACADLQDEEFLEFPSLVPENPALGGRVASGADLARRP